MLFLQTAYILRLTVYTATYLQLKNLNFGCYSGNLKVVTSNSRFVFKVLLQQYFLFVKAVEIKTIGFTSLTRL